MRLSHLAAVATIVALLGAMFVALPSASAQAGTAYTCKVNDKDTEAVGDDVAEIHNGSAFVGALNVETGMPAAATGDPVDGVDCTVVTEDGNGATVTTAVGDEIEIKRYDSDTDGDVDKDDMYRWQRVYEEMIKVEEDQQTETITLLTDNPNNPKKGADGAARPQKWTIPAIGAFSADDGDKIENSDKSGKIVVFGTYDSNTGWPVSAGMAGKATITVTNGIANNPSTVATYTFDVQDKVKAAADAATEAAKSPSLKIAFPNDSDGVVSDGTDVKVMITKAGGATLSSVTVSGGLDLYSDDATKDPSEPGAQIGSRAGANMTTLWVVIPKGQAAGEYTVAANGTESATSDKKISASKMITVGDSGTNVTTASLTLSPLDADGMPTTVAKAQSTQRSSAAAGGDAKTGTVYLSLAVLNSLDKASNPPFTVTISAAGANIDVMKVEKDDVEVQAAKSSQTGSLTFDAMAANLTLKITKATPGAVSVSAIVVDKAGGGYDGSDLIDLTFTGVSSEISLGDASGTLLMKSATSLDDDGKDTDKRDVISFSLGAVDKSGNATSIPDVSFQVTDPDGVNVPESKIAVSQGPSTAGLPNAKITLETKAGAATPLDNGEYTIKVSQSATITDTAMFTVVGVGTSVEVEASNMAPDSVGDTVEVTATVADADGNPVADGTKVMFTSSDQTADSDQVLAHVGDRGAQSTKGGMAKATFVAVGDGTSVITAIADGTTGVVVVDSTAGAPEPVVEPEPEPEVASVDCLSNLSGFSTWSCGVDADASAIFGMVSGRGVTAIHLWNGTNWVRYSVDAEGTSIPGSSDFMVTENDILYVSN